MNNEDKLQEMSALLQKTVKNQIKLAELSVETSKDVLNQGRQIIKMEMEIKRLNRLLKLKAVNPTGGNTKIH